MIDVIEDVRNEFKIKLTDNFEKEVISFLNTSGGNLYIGISDKGEVVGTNRNQVLTQGKTWEEAINQDWRKTKSWQPGWKYIVSE